MLERFASLDGTAFRHGGHEAGGPVRPNKFYRKGFIDTVGCKFVVGHIEVSLLIDPNSASRGFSMGRFNIGKRQKDTTMIGG